MENSLQPLNNFLTVAIPHRYVQKQALQGNDKLLIRPYQMTPGLETQIANGYGDIPFELDEQAERELVREGLVLALPPQLTEDLYVCAGPFSKPRTGKDIHPEVEVGDTVHLDSAYLTDENEIQPGIYRLPYTAVIATLDDFNVDHVIGGYALLDRVYPDGAALQEDGSYAVLRGGLWEAVAPIPNEGVIQWLSIPLGKNGDRQYDFGDRVLFEGYPRLETIRGTEYIVVQQDTIAAVLDRKETKLAVLPLDSKYYAA